MREHGGIVGSLAALVVIVGAGIMIKTDAGTCSTYRMVILA